MGNKRENHKNDLMQAKDEETNHNLLLQSYYIHHHPKSLPYSNTLGNRTNYFSAINEKQNLFSLNKDVIEERALVIVREYIYNIGMTKWKLEKENIDSLFKLMPRDLQYYTIFLNYLTNHKPTKNKIINDNQVSTESIIRKLELKYYTLNSKIEKATTIEEKVNLLEGYIDEYNKQADIVNELLKRSTQKNRRIPHIKKDDYYIKSENGDTIINKMINLYSGGKGSLRSVFAIAEGYAFEVVRKELDEKYMYKIGKNKSELVNLSGTKKSNNRTAVIDLGANIPILSDKTKEEMKKKKETLSVGISVKRTSTEESKVKIHTSSNFRETFSFLSENFNDMQSNNNLNYDNGIKTIINNTKNNTDILNEAEYYFINDAPNNSSPFMKDLRSFLRKMWPVFGFERSQMEDTAELLEINNQIIPSAVLYKIYLQSSAEYSKMVDVNIEKTKTNDDILSDTNIFVQGNYYNKKYLESNKDKREKYFKDMTIITSLTTDFRQKINDYLNESLISSIIIELEKYKFKEEQNG